MNRKRFCCFGLFGCLSLLAGCGGGGSNPTGESTPTPAPDLSRYTVRELGYFLPDGAELNEVGDVLLRHRNGSGSDYTPYRYHKGYLVNFDSDAVSALSPSDARYVSKGVVHTEEGTPLPTPTGLPGTYSDGNYGKVVTAERIAGEWAYGNTRPNAGALYDAQPFRWKISAGPVEAVGNPGDYEYKSAGEQFISTVSGGGDRRVLVRTINGRVFDGVSLMRVLVIEPDGTRVSLDKLGGGDRSWPQVRAEVALDGTVVGSGSAGFSAPDHTERAFVYGNDRKVTLGPPGHFLGIQGSDYLFEANEQQFLWTPAQGKKAVPVSPLGKDVVVAKRNARGQWLVAIKQGTSDPKFSLLTPK